MLFLSKSQLRRKLLAYSFTHPDESFYVRELAVRMKEDPGNLSRELRRLEAEGLYRSTQKGTLKFYSLNPGHALFKELKEIVSKTEGVEGALRELAGAYPGISLAFLYGSYAKGTEKKASDIDLVLIGKFPQAQLLRQVRALESRLGREINFTSYTAQEFAREREKTGGFLDLILKGKIILLKGTLNDG